MARLAPPPPPPLTVALADEDNFRRTQFLFRQVWLTVLTVLVTTWFITLGPIPAVIALVVAKHVLVAILVMGLGVDARQEAEI